MSGGFTSTSPDFLVRAEVYSQQLKDVLYADLQGQGYVHWMTDFPDGVTFNIPSVNTMAIDNYVEDTDVKYRSMSTGNFQFTITEYISSATYITEKEKQDSFYTALLMSMFVPKEHRAIMEDLETKIWNLQSGQTASNTNTINGAAHRFVGSDTSSGAGYGMSPSDVAKALYALKRANVPQRNLIAIVDPSVEFTLNTKTNIVNVQNNPMWEGVIASGLASGMRFIKNVYGFDFYTSQFLPTANETITNATTSGKSNLFFSADMTVLPFIGAWRQPPKVDAEWNKDKQREEYVTTARYGIKLYRPENLVCILTDTAVVV